MSRPPEAVEVLVEVSRGDFIRRDASGRIVLLSPLPCPFNYGSAPGFAAADGDAADVVVLGPRLAKGHRERLLVVGRVRFVDGGLEDDKWVCARHRPDRKERALLRVFFRLYALGKAMAGPLRRQKGPTRFLGLETWEPGLAGGPSGDHTAPVRAPSRPG